MNKMPVLFYGVKLGDLPRSRCNLPPNVRMNFIDLEDPDYSVKIRALGKHVSERDLEIMINEDGSLLGGIILPSRDLYSLEEIYVGNYLNGSVERENTLEPGVVKFNFHKVKRIINNPSVLIKKLNKLGLEVKIKELRLYGSLITD